jgi:RNA-directed DNA polymerase
LPYLPKLHPEKVSTESIASVASLCSALSITRAELDEALALPSDVRYSRSIIPKKDGTPRVVNNPHHVIRRIQRRINKRIFSNQKIVKWPDHVFGSVPNDDTSLSPAAEKDYVNCARQHCEAKSILSVDIKNFFDNIHRDQVTRIFEDFLKYPPDVSAVLADICCLESHIVQGALTSSYIATLCLFSSEGDLVQRMHHKGLTYTRLVDDITISAKVANYDFGYALGQVERVLATAGLPLNTSKTKIQYASMNPLIVHGIRVDFKEPRLPPDEPKKIRASVNNLELLAASPGYRASRAYRKDFNRCFGRVNKLARVNHSQHPKLVEKLRRILPLPSHKDLERAQLLIDRLMKDCLKPNYKETYWFYKRCNVASERLVILHRSFPKKATELRKKLRSIRPKKKYE